METPETMTLNTYASMLETSHSRLQKSVFHVDETSDILQYSVVKNRENTNQYSTPGKKVMNLEADSRLTAAEAILQSGTTPSRTTIKNRPPLPPPPHHSSYNKVTNIKSQSKKPSESRSAANNIASSTSSNEGIKKGSAIHFSASTKQVPLPPSISSKPKDSVHYVQPRHQQRANYEQLNETGDARDHEKHEEDTTGEDENKMVKTGKRSNSPIVLTQRNHRQSKQLVDWSSVSSSEKSSGNMRSLTWFPFQSSTNYHLRGKRNIITRGLHRLNHNNNNNGSHNKNQLKGSGQHNLESTGSGLTTVRSGESRENWDTANLKALAYTDSEFYSHSELSSGNLYFVCALFCLLIACVFVVSFMLLPFKRCPRNHHVPVIIWSATILCSVCCDIESSVHPRLAFGWILLETFLIWITLPLRMRTALFYTMTLAALYVVVTSLRERNRPYLGRQVRRGNMWIFQYCSV